MEVRELVSILREHGRDPVRCARELLGAARESRREELVVSFSVALGTGRLDARAVELLLAAFDRLRASAVEDVYGEAGLDGLRAEVAELSARREESKASREEFVMLQDAVRVLAAEESVAEEGLASLALEVRELETERGHLAAISAEVDG